MSTNDDQNNASVCPGDKCFFGQSCQRLMGQAS
jgi:hypothetical protein